VIVNNFYVMGIPAGPDKNDSPLSIDPNGMLAFAISSERLQLIPGRRCEDAKLRGGVKLQ